MKATILLIYVLISVWTLVLCNNKLNPLEEVWDPKHFKQLLRTRTNVLVLFTKAKTTASSVYRVFKDAALEVRGLGTLLTVDCSGQGQKLCRQLKATPDPHVMHHYKDGKFHKVFDRKESTKSIVQFMQDPTGDVPWEEEPEGKHVVHLENPKNLEKLLKKHKTALVMFYAPWCVYCKQMKPEYAAAATAVQSSNLGVLAAMDVVRTENSAIRAKYNITGFPTVYLFKNGKISATYEGENKQASIVEFMRNPQAAPVKTKEVPWSEEESLIQHLSTDNFDQTIKENPSALVMFYAPWCGHCKKLKPEWVKAAAAVDSQKISAVVAAVDSTKETALSGRFKVKGYPTIKYFKDGEFAFDTPNLRDAKKIVDFLLDPKEPPPAPPPEPNWADVPSEVMHLNEQNFMKQLRSKRHALVMFYAPWCGHCKAAKPEFEAAAEKLKDEPRMVVAAVNCVESADLCQTNKVNGYPTFKYFKYYKESSNYDGGRKMADFVQFFKKLEPDSVHESKAENQPSSIPDKSQSVTNQGIKKNEDSRVAPSSEGILHLTDKNLKAVLSEHDHLFVLFYTDTCRPCMDLKRVLVELSGSGDVDSSLVTLAACETDKSPRAAAEFLVKSLPTLKYFRAGQFVTDFRGESTVPGLRNFLNKVKIKKDEL